MSLIFFINFAKINRNLIFTDWLCRNRVFFNVTGRDLSKRSVVTVKRSIQQPLIYYLRHKKYACRD